MVKHLPASVGDATDVGLIPGLGRQHTLVLLLESSIDREAW